MGSIDYDSLCHPTAGFVDNKQCLHLLVEITARAGAPKASPHRPSSTLYLQVHDRAWLAHMHLLLKSLYSG